MANHERDVVKERFWRGVLRRQAASGLTIRAFCRREQLTESAFFAWRRTVAERDAEAKSPTGRSTASRRRGGRLERPAFVPVVVDEDHRHDGVLGIELAGGRVLRLSGAIGAQRLAELVHALEAGTPR